MEEKRAALGKIGEDAAAGLYESRGYAVVARNWRCAAGEIDLVVRRERLLVFCEVKTRSGSRFGGGFEAVGWRKQRKLHQLAEMFISDRRLAPEAVRFDVASVGPSVRPGSPAVDVHVFEDAF